MENSGNNESLKNAIDDIKDKNVRSLIDYQGKQLESFQKLFKTESIKNQVFQLLFTENDIKNVIDAILRYFHEIFPGDIRCIICPDQESYHSSPNLLFTLGEKDEEFSYLDEQIEHLLETRRHVLISDTSKSRELKYLQNKPYPVAVAAFPIKKPVKNQKVGFIWVASNQPYDFSREKIRLVFELVDVLSISINFHLEKLKNKFDHDIYSSIVDSLNDPYMLLTHKFELIWSNHIANNIFFGSQDDLSDTIIENKILQCIKEKLDEKKEGFFLQTENGSFKVVNLLAGVIKSDGLYLLKFIDYTDEVRKNELLSLILNIINSNLKLSMDRLQGLIKLLSTQGIINEHQNDSITKIDEEISHVNNLLIKFLTFKRFQNSERVIFEDIEAKEIIDYALQVLSSKAIQKGIAISKEVINTIISADRVLITQAIINLIDNAIKYSHLGGEIFIKEYLIDKKWRIEVKDNGKGMSTIDVKQLLNDSAYTVSEMKGFDVVKEIARLHGGAVNIESNLGEGTKASIEIPSIKE